MTGLIYCFINTKNNKRYIGSTTNVELRKNQHIKSKLDDEFHNDLRNNPNDFRFEILEDNISYSNEKRIELNERELYWIKFYNSVEDGYNTSYVCDGNDFTEDRKKNVSNALKKVMTEELKNKISEATKRAMKNPEIRKKCAKAMKGKTYTMDEERKQKISQAKKGMTFSEEHKKHLSEARKGKIPANKGIAMDSKTKQQISQSKKGKHRVYTPDGKYHYE